MFFIFGTLGALASGFVPEDVKKNSQRPGASDLIVIASPKMFQGNPGKPIRQAFLDEYRRSHDGDEPAPYFRTEAFYTIIVVDEVIANVASLASVQPGDSIAVASRDRYGWYASPNEMGVPAMFFLRPGATSSHTELPMFVPAFGIQGIVVHKEPTPADERCTDVAVTNRGQRLHLFGYDPDVHGIIEGIFLGGFVAAEETVAGRECDGLTWDAFVASVRGEVEIYHPNGAAKAQDGNEQ